MLVLMYNSPSWIRVLLKCKSYWRNKVPLIRVCKAGVEVWQSFLDQCVFESISPGKIPLIRVG